MAWNKKIAETVGKEVRKRLRGVSILELKGDDLLAYAVAEEVLSIVRRLDGETVKIKDIDQLLADARCGAGLED